MSFLKDRYINPLTLQNKIFEKLFDAAEIAKFTKQEREAYEESLKYYRDIKNVVDTSREEGILEGIDKRNLEIAIQMKKDGEPLEKIIRYTKLSKDQIDKL